MEGPGLELPAVAGEEMQADGGWALCWAAWLLGIPGAPLPAWAPIACVGRVKHDYWLLPG